jgi:hypothetical protein
MAGLRTTSGVVFVIGGRSLHVPGKLFLAPDFDGVGWHSTGREFGGSVGFTWLFEISGCLRDEIKFTLRRKRKVHH